MENSNLSPNAKRSKSHRVHKRLKKKLLTEKENGFVLDCLNQQKSSLKSYNTIHDKFLNYFIVRVHPNVTKSHKKFNSFGRVQRI